MKKVNLLLGLFCITLLMCNFASAGIDKSFIKDNERTSEKTNYGTIKLVESKWYDIFGWADEKVKDITLKSNTESCSNNCEEIHKQVLYKDGILIEDSRYWRIYENGSRKLGNIRSEKFFIQDGTEISVEPVMEWTCKDTGKINKNGTKEKTCENKRVGLKQVETPIWKEYEIGTSVKAGTYVIKHIGEKRADWVYDWEFKTNGVWTNEWAVWGGYSTIYETHGKTITGSASDSNGYGLSFITKFPDGGNHSLNAIYKQDGDNTLRAIIKNNVGTIIANVSFSGNIAITNVTLSNNTNYTVYGEGGTSRRRYNGASPALPYIGTLINWNGLYYDGVVYQSSNNLPGTILGVNISKVLSSITLNSPVNYYNSTISLISFNATATVVGATFSNWSLWTNATGSWALANTSTTNGGILTYDFVNDGKYLWGVQACDSDGDCGWSENRTLTIDATPPTINILYPSGNIGVPSISGNFTFNYTVTDTNLGTCWYEYGGSNNTISCTSGVNNAISLALNNSRNITLWVNDTAGNINNTKNEFEWKIKMNMKDSTGELVDNYRWLVNGIEYTINPLTFDSSVLLGSLINNSLNVVAEDLDGYSSTINTTTNFNVNQSEYNYTLNPKELKLWFYNESGSLYSTKIYWVDSIGNNGVLTSNNLSLPLMNLSEGIVDVMFGYNLTSFANYTQFYEFNNEWGTEIETNLTVLQNTGKSSYLKTVEKDVKTNAINDVLVKLYQIFPEQGNSKKLIGQRFTGRQQGTGMTFFWSRDDANNWIGWEHNDYENDGDYYDLNLLTASESEPVIIPLVKTVNYYFDGLYASICGWYNMNTTIIPLSVYSPRGGVIKMNTSYNSVEKILPLDSNYRKVENITNGNYFNNADTTNLTVYLYKDGVLKITMVVPYWGTTDTKFVEPSGLHTTTKTRLFWLGLLISVGVLGILIKKEDDGSGSGGMGKHLFFIGIITISIISGGLFSWLLYIAGFHYLLLAINKLIKE